jgi:catechol 2,3-dioxygenase-like lactoylglutathione lyase family enzyme
MEILFVAGFAPIVQNPGEGQAFYRDVLGLPLATDPANPDYAAMTDTLGVKHFGVWPLIDAAQSCFGVREWPAAIPIPQATIEFELASVEAVDEGVGELRRAGYELLHDTRTEPWGQAVARLLGPEGLLIGLSYAPWLHGGD